MDFMIGCNYWASNAGAEMWREFDPNCIEQDIIDLSELGITYLRVFPIWRDFQPVIPLMSARMELYQYSMEGDKAPSNPFYLDETMLERFSQFLDICGKYHIKVLIGLITGWMSGRLFVPPAVYGKNLITDPVAQYFEQLFIKGFVERFKDRPEIYLWEPGNECSCLSAVESRYEASSWTAMICNAIRAADPTRPVYSSIHSATLHNGWRIGDQALLCDGLVTHPYPFWHQHTRMDKMLSLPISLFPTAQTKYFSEIGNKPCITEELGTIGPMLVSDENAAKFLRINLLSLWANGSEGLFWWCNHQQDHLTSFPYSVYTPEQELGLFYADGSKKPVGMEMEAFANKLKAMGLTLPPANTDGVCLLTTEQDQWGVGFMTYALAKKAGLNLRFAFAEYDIPDAPLYLIPSVKGCAWMEKNKIAQVLQKVEQGADLYLSADDAVIAGLGKMTGLKVLDYYDNTEQVEISLKGKTLKLRCQRHLLLQTEDAQILATDQTGNPALTVCSYGKGRVYFANFPLEAALVDQHGAMEDDYQLIYETIFNNQIHNRAIGAQTKNVITTYHVAQNRVYIVMLNHSDTAVDHPITLLPGWSIEKVYYGDPDRIDPWNGCVLQLGK